MTEPFAALVIEDEQGQGAFFRQLAQADLPDHDVLVEVAFPH